MKPNFALSLTHESVALLHRAPNGWLLVGSVALDSDDLAGEMSFWRSTAQTLAPHGVTCKLVIPNSEVLYRHLHAPGPDEERRRAQIVAQIDGLTPYRVDELAFDWAVTPAGVHVAIVARETLAEAEAFAVSHKLNPVSFVAQPDAADFAGEPFFGPTGCAARILGPGVVPQRDAVPLAVNGKATVPPRPDLLKDERPNAEPTKAEPTKAAPPPAPGSAAPASPAPATAVPPVPAATSAPKPAASAETPGALSLMASKLVQAVRPGPANPAPPSPTATQPKAIAVKLDPGAPVASAADALTKADLPAPAIGIPRSGGDAKVPDAKARLSGPDAPIIAFRSGRSGKVDPVLVASPAPEVSSGRLQLPQQPKRPGARFAERAGALLKGITAPASAEVKAGGKSVLSPDVESDSSTAKSATSKPVAPEPVAPEPQALKPEVVKPGTLKSGTPKPDTQANSVMATTPVAGPKPAGPATTASPAKAAAAETDARKAEAEAMTVFGARRNAHEDKGFMKRGVLLTVGLLLILGAVALASVLLTGTSDTGVAGQSATAPAPVAPPAPLSLTQDAAPESESAAPHDVAADPGPVPDPAATRPDADPVPAPDATVADGAVIADADPAATDPVPDETGPVTGDSDAAVREALGLPADPVPAPTEDADGIAAPDSEASTATGLAATDAQTGPQGTNPPQPDQGGFALSTTTAPALADLIAGLPTLSPPGDLASAPPLSLPPPAPFGTEFDLGPDGLVVPTPEGALTPQGIRVHSGSPGVRPPTRPEAPPMPEPATAEPDAAAPAQQQGALPQPDVALPSADPALAGFRPRTRPAAAADAETAIATADENPAAPGADPSLAAAATGGDDAPVPSPSVTASPGGLALTALAGVRPAPRPSDLVAGAGSISTGALSAAADETNEAADAAIVADNPMAVAASLRPNNRPSDFAARVQAAAAVPPTATAPPVQQASAAAAATPRPSIPSSASVSEQATQARAINLRQVNLLGVFGTANNRAALVRLSNGNVVRVSVGDTLDGGRVSSISDTELRYVKRGRNEVLTIGSSS